MPHILSSIIPNKTAVYEYESVYVGRSFVISITQRIGITPDIDIACGTQPFMKNFQKKWAELSQNQNSHK